VSLFLLDTSALLAHFRKETGWETVKAIFDDPDALIFVASVTLPEFARRLLALGFDAGAALETTSSYRLLMNEVVAIDEAMGLSAFEIGRQSAERLPLVDALIAAASLSKKATLVHRDKHLASIPRHFGAQLLLS
jgi:predicted nucleic acid-binding protein